MDDRRPDRRGDDPSDDDRRGAARDDGRQHDAGQPDARQPDARQPDARQPDARQPDAGQPDRGRLDGRRGPRRSEDERHPLRRAREDRAAAEGVPDTPQTRSPAYRLAFDDPELLLRDEMRGLRLQLEMTKAERLMDEAGVVSTVALFGGARIPSPERAHEARSPMLADLARYYEEARRFARLVTERGEAGENVVVTGGGPGVMEAGNLGALDAGGRSIGLGIVLPHEQAPNLYVTPELCFNFHYFATRKIQFLIRARAVAVFPGGFGTLDELFETLTLIQTGRMERIPVLLFGRAFWERVVDFGALAEAGTIAPSDLDLFRYVETADEALAAIDAWPPAPPRDEIPGRPEPESPSRKARAPEDGSPVDPEAPRRRSPDE